MIIVTMLVFVLPQVPGCSTSRQCRGRCYMQLGARIHVQHPGVFSGLQRDSSRASNKQPFMPQALLPVSGVNMMFKWQHMVNGLHDLKSQICPDLAQGMDATPELAWSPAFAAVAELSAKHDHRKKGNIIFGHVSHLDKLPSTEMKLSARLTHPSGRSALAIQPCAWCRL